METEQKRETNFQVILLQEKIKKLWEEGYSGKQIALMCDRKQASISRFMKKLGIAVKEKIHQNELKIIQESNTRIEAAEKLCITPAGVSIKVRRFKQLGLM